MKTIYFISSIFFLNLIFNFEAKGELEHITRLQTHLAREIENASPVTKYSLLRKIYLKDQKTNDKKINGDFLKKLISSYDRYAKRSPISKEGKELVLAQNLLSHSSVLPEIFPNDSEKYWFELTEFQSFLNLQTKYINTLSAMPANERFKAINTFHEYIALDLIRRHSKIDVWGFDFASSLSWDNNVAQVPDDLVLPTGRSGLSLGLNTKASRKFRERNGIQWDADIFGSASEFFDSDFSAYEYLNLGLGTGVKIPMKNKGKLTYLKPSFTLMGTFTSGGGTSNKELSYLTYNNSVFFGFKPKINIGKLSDIFVMFNSLGFIFQDYRDSLSDDLTGFNFQWIGVNIFKSKIEHRSNFLFGLSSRNSDSTSQHYTNLRFDVIHTFKFKTFEISPGLSWQHRDYNKFSGGRKDQTFETSLSSNKKLGLKGSQFRIILKYLNRESTVNFFSYNSTQVLTELKFPF